MIVIILLCYILHFTLWFLWPHEWLFKYAFIRFILVLYSSPGIDIHIISCIHITASHGILSWLLPFRTWGGPGKWSLQKCAPNTVAPISFSLSYCTSLEIVRKCTSAPSNLWKLFKYCPQFIAQGIFPGTLYVYLSLQISGMPESLVLWWVQHKDSWFSVCLGLFACLFVSRMEVLTSSLFTCMS